MYTAQNEHAIWPAVIASIMPPRTSTYVVSPVATPLSMMCPLMLGRYSDAIVLPSWSNTTSASCE